MNVDLPTVGLVSAGVVALYAAWEQYDLQRKRGSIPGPKFVVPFLGSMLDIIRNPFEYYERQRDYGAISWGAALGKLILFTRDSDMTRKIMDNPQNFTLWLTMGAKQILGDENIAFMTGEPHKNLRKKILPLFTPRALSIFLRVQEACIRKHLQSWLEQSRGTATETDFGEFFETRPLVRDMNLETSSLVFVGNYFNDEQRKIAADLFWEMSAGFLTFPVNIPGTQLNKAVKARERLVDMYTECLHKARARMAIPGETAECMLDVWVEEEVKLGKTFDNDKEIGFHFMDFLFASQDASTSSIVWTIALLAKHRDVLARVIEEINTVRPVREDGTQEPITNELVAKMTYTKQVVKEVLRFRPPATMVPHIAVNDSQVGQYEIKKGTVILPSIWSAHIDDFPQPEKFDPERFNNEREKDPKTAKSFLAFGYGPHRCIGMQYALNHLICFASEMARTYDWKRKETPNGDDIVFLPTIFPKDGVLISLRKKD